MTTKKKIVIALILLATLGIGGVYADAFTVHYSAIRKIRAPQLSTSSLTNPLTYDFNIGTTATTSVYSGSANGTVTTNDVVYNYYNSATVLTSCSVQISMPTTTATFTNVTPSIATSDSSGNVTYVSPGTAQFNVRVGKRTKGVTCPMSLTGSSYSTTFNSFSGTSLAKHVTDQVDTRLNLLSPSGTTQNIYSSTNDTSHVYVRNTSNFAADVDLTFIPAYTAGSGSQTMGVLVTPDIMIQADHSHPSGTVYFVTSTSTTVTRSITSGMNITGTDIYVARLNAPFLSGSGVTPAKVMGAGTIGTYTGSSAVNGTKITNTALANMAVPVVYTNQARTLNIGTANLFYSSNFNLFTPYKGCATLVDLTKKYATWYTPIVGGDSGSPSFFIVNGTGVVLGVWHTICNPSNISGKFTQINTAISTLGSSYPLTAVDLSGFSSY